MNSDIRNLISDMLDRIVRYACDAPTDPTSADKVLIARANAMLQLPDNQYGAADWKDAPAGGAWYPSYDEMKAARPTWQWPEAPRCTAEAIGELAIDLYRERGGQVGGEVVGWQKQYIDPIEGPGLWTDCTKAEYDFRNSAGCDIRYNVRELVVRGSGQVDDDAAQAYQDQLEDAEVHARMIREALGVAYEPHQSLHERTLERVRELTSQPAVAGEAVAEIVPTHGDPETFGEREVRILGDIMKLKYGTKLYSRPQPTVPDDVMAAAEYSVSVACIGTKAYIRAELIRDWLKSTNAAAAKDAT